MKKLLISLGLLLALFLVLAYVTSCSKSPNSNFTHLYVVVKVDNKFFGQIYTSSVQLTQGSTAVAQQVRQATGNDTLDMGTLPSGTYSLSTTAYKTSQGSVLPPVYSYTGAVTVANSTQYLVISPQ